MQEDYLHYLWEFQKWQISGLSTTEGLPVTVLAPGMHNQLSGPDFFNSRVVIGEQEWAGNVEIHIHSSDWYRHGHEKDPAYDNVILHVVWQHDSEIFRKDRSVVPVLELQNLVAEETVEQYRDLISASSEKWINCQKDLPQIDSFIFDKWLERLYIERLEAKSVFVFDLLKRSAGDWEEVLFKLLAKNFGLNVNGDAFLSMAESIPFSVIRKCRNDRDKLEALFLGQAGLLEKEVEEPNFWQLRENYLFLKNKFSLTVEGITPVKYFRLRPDNFPEVRLSQVAAVYHRREHLFSKVIKAENPEHLKELFKAEAAEFWRTHYTFSKTHPVRKKQLSNNFLDLLVINSLVPLKFCYQKAMGKEGGESLLELMRQLPAEANRIIKKFTEIRPGSAENAFSSQALLHMKKDYCERSRCLQCSLGLNILHRKPVN
ncbi:DUF2851 family protein [Salinimicrobium catena]|uniref:DUF2851 family protein n=1 Tax=Salinimicrobium catena TaxID=390640 RepID=UPI002FE433B7